MLPQSWLMCNLDWKKLVPPALPGAAAHRGIFESPDSARTPAEPKDTLVRARQWPKVLAQAACTCTSCVEQDVQTPHIRQKMNVCHLKTIQPTSQGQQPPDGHDERGLTVMTSLRAACLAAGSSTLRAAAPLASSSSNSFTTTAMSVSCPARAA